MDEETAEQVRTRAQNRCEYCHVPQSAYEELFQIDHIISRQHGGDDSMENLALACIECNRRKGPNIASIEILTRELIPLFDPRRDKWNDHFAWQAARIVGLDKTGRATVRLLELNRAPRVLARSALIEEGVFPPAEDTRISI